MQNVKEVLLETKRVPEMAIKSIANQLGDNSEAIWRHFVSSGRVTESEVFQAFARVNRLQYLDLRTKEISSEALALLSSSFCRREQLIPIEIKGEKLLIGTPYPDNFQAIDEISTGTYHTIVVVVVSPSELQETFNRHLRSDEEIDKLSEEIESVVGADDDENGDLSTNNEDETPVVRFVNLLIAQAIQDRASDIHVEPGEKLLRVRYRIDGVLHEVQKADKSIQKGVISRLKVMSDIDIGERRKPQDGRLSARYGGQSVDIRVVTLPTTWGEKIVMRILDHSTEKRSISSIGMSPENEAIFNKSISKSHGMILVTGPTGSGKALPLDAKIPTPDGFTTMDKIQQGDKVIGGNGKVHNVTSVSEIVEHSAMYELTFGGTDKVTADADHQWLVTVRDDENDYKVSDANRKEKAKNNYLKAHQVATKIMALSLEFTDEFGLRTADEIVEILRKEGISYYSVAEKVRQDLHMVDVDGVKGERDNQVVIEFPIRVSLQSLAKRIRERHLVSEVNGSPVMRMTTKEMFDTGLRTGDFDRLYKFAVPMAKPVELPQKDLLIDPYVLGSYFGFINNKEVTNFALDFEEEDREKLVNLAKIVSADRFVVPMDYLRASFEQRVSLLKGFVNADKSIDKNMLEPELLFYENDKRNLTKSFEHLLKSLGVKVYSNFGLTDNDGEIYHRIGFVSDSSFSEMFAKFDEYASAENNKFDSNLFNASFADVMEDDVEDSKWNYITSIEPCGVESAKCISVDSPDFTYLVGEDFVVTSNSTTIYTALDEVALPGVNVVTVEDPVEKKIAGISQMQINNKAGMTFSNALRSILRADPDIIFLGEIRDAETAKIAVDASMTGHLVLSTLHTNGAPEAAARLSEMGVEPYLVGSSVSCVVAQRLARKLCPDCKEEIETDQASLDKVEFPYRDATLFKPVGCSLCSQTGYKGRVALTEIMEMTEHLEPLIIAQKTANEIRNEAEKHGFVSLKLDGWDKVRQGLTTIEEVLRVAA